MTLFPEALQASGDVIRDIDGDELFGGQKYYAVSSLGAGGGVSLGNIIHSSSPRPWCSFLRNPSDRGTPVTASTKCEPGTAITDSTSVFISFNTTSTCAESTEWRFEENRGFMTIGEGKTKTEFRIINKGWRFGNGYKLLAMFFSDFGFETVYVGAI